jgi:molybdopterin synthase catalytic subunit
MYQISDRPISADELAELVADPAAGGICVFLGVVRDNTHGRRVRHLEYEAHVPMAEAKMKEIGQEVAERFGLHRVAMVHRIGRLAIGEASVGIAVAAPHRRMAFEACQYAIDRLKVVVPIWKKEVFEDGEVWVGPAGLPS